MSLDKDKKAIIPKELAYVSGELFNDYIHDMKIVQRFAELNRKAMILYLQPSKPGLTQRVNKTWKYINIIQHTDVCMSF
jgi:hypothetical protein